MSTVKNGYPNSLSYSWQQGSDEQVQEQKEKFITATNNLHATGENINKLKRGFQVITDFFIIILNVVSRLLQILT